MLRSSLASQDFPRITTCKPRRNLNDEKHTSCWPMVKMDYAIEGKDAFGLSKKLSTRRREGDKLTTPLITPRAAAEGGELEEWDFEAREVRLDQEFWAAAWLRAECYFENSGHERNAESNKLEFANKWFMSLKERTNSKLGTKYKCIIMVKNEDGKSTLLERVVGTLDLIPGYFKPGQTFPEQPLEPPPTQLGPMVRRDRSKCYGFILNVCVTKTARRRGHGSRMVEFALSTAREEGMEQVFLEVGSDNEGAVGLYEKMGFWVLDEGNGEGSSVRRMLMCYKASR